MTLCKAEGVSEPMTDVVIKFPVRGGEEAELFGHYLNQFIEHSSAFADEAADGDAPYVMVRSDPLPDLEMKVLIFQEKSAATAFSDGWAEARGALKAS